jgi:phosphatidylglycerophosphatase C
VNPADGVSGVDGTGSTLAAFDVDGTLTRRDTLLPFLRRLCGTQRLARALARHGLALSAMVVGRVERDTVKGALLVHLLAGWNAEEVRAAGVDYAGFLVRSDRLRPDTLARLQAHQGAGHRVVLISASPDVYLTPLGQHLGVDAVLCTGLEEDTSGRLTGRLAGRNCRGPEKVARLEAWLDGDGASGPYLYAYGDSAGDRELLARADEAVLVRPRRPMAGLAPLR